MQFHCNYISKCKDVRFHSPKGTNSNIVLYNYRSYSVAQRGSGAIKIEVKHEFLIHKFWLILTAPKSAAEFLPCCRLLCNKYLYNPDFCYRFHIYMFTSVPGFVYVFKIKSDITFEIRH